ncbi:MAG: hypothetical protein ACRC0F_00575 [Cetobacterium sp.]
MWRCKCGGEVVAEGYKRNWVRQRLDSLGDPFEIIESENEENIVDFYECRECGASHNVIESIAIWTSEEL